MEGYLSLIDGAVEAQRKKWLGNTALDQGFAQKLLHSNERHSVITKAWVDQRCSWMLVKQNDPTTLRHTSEFNHDLLDWFDKVWWGLCSVSGADLAWFGQGIWDSYYEVALLVVRERGTESHTTSFVARAAPTSGRHFLAVQRKAVVVSANQMRSGDQGWGGGGYKRWEKAWICL